MTIKNKKTPVILPSFSIRDKVLLELLKGSLITCIAVFYAGKELGLILLKYSNIIFILLLLYSLAILDNC